MKSLVLSPPAASALALPVASFAQNAEQPITRAQVSADVVKAGQQDMLHPSKAHNAAAENAARASTDTSTGYGPSTYGSTRSGSVIPLGPHNTLFSHH